MGAYPEVQSLTVVLEVIWVLQALKNLIEKLLFYDY
jgi:hypothetical protein